MVALHLRTRPWIWRTTPIIRNNTCRWQWVPNFAASQLPCTQRRKNSAKTDDTPQSIGSSSLSRILSDEQRSLFHQVNQLSSMSRSLARQVGNVPVKEDSLLGDIARLQNQRRMRQQQQKNQQQQQPQEHQKINETANDSLPSSLFTVVFAGEFNSGKSTLINALLGNELLDTGVLPTTDAITIMMANNDDGTDSNDNNDKNGTSSMIESSSIGLNTGVPALTQLHLLPPSKFPFSDLCLIDTPGTNAILSLQHTSSTLRILHDADLIVFVTSADRPFSESEKTLLQTSIKSYRKRVVIVINKMDVLERQQGEDHGEATKKRVEEYVVEHAADLLGARPFVIPLSARDALSVKMLYSSRGSSGANGGGGGDSFNTQTSLWKRSNFAKLEHFLSKTLTASSKVKTKLLNPIGVSEGILIDCQNEIEQRQTELDVDVMTLRLLTSQTDAWEKEQAEVIDKCQSDVRDAIINRSEMASKVLHELSVFDQWKMGMGMGGDTFDHAWESAGRRGRSTRTTSKAQDGNSNENTLGNEMLSVVGECVETLSTRAQTQGTASIEYLGKRPAVIGSGSKGRSDGSGISRMVGSVSVPKFQQLKEVQSSMAITIRNSTSDLPDNSQCKDSVYASLCRTVLLSSVLLGSGVVPATLSMSGSLDMTTGMVASGTLALLGCASLPLSNRHAAQSFENKWMDDATQLEAAIETLFKDALHQIRTELSDSVAPYSRYVKTEGDWLKELSDQMETGISRAHGLRSKINKSCQ